VRTASKIELTDGQQLLIEGRHYNPFSVLGPQVIAGESAKHIVTTVFRPDAKSLAFRTNGGEETLQPIGNSGLFIWQGLRKNLPEHPLIIQEKHDGSCSIFYDAYSFSPQIPEDELHRFGFDSHWHAYKILGAHPTEIDGIAGVLFSVWAPNAERVSVVGDFNHWDGRVCPMRSRGASGVWELFLPGVMPGTLYKYEIRKRDSGEILVKSDPYGQQFEFRPSTASIVHCGHYRWRDNTWMALRQEWNWLQSPISIYELHLGSWKRGIEGEFLNYREIAEQLVPYVLKLGFTHIQLMPVTEHPFDGSWGYQATGYFAATSRFGTADDLKYLIDKCHNNHIGVFLDWVPGHFPRDEHALANFDGSNLYEHEDPGRREHKDWGTLIFNYGRTEVKNFLLSSAFYWLEEFHIDGLRVDAVASMLYLDYSREEGEWTPNIYGGNENLEAIEFLREVNSVLHLYHPGAVVIAEESTSWPQVSGPVYLGGLGFSMKWNMGWMNDTLAYFQQDPIHRKFFHDKLTFGLLYAFSENFVLPLSHDEVVHGKRSLLNKMPGDDWQRFANLRLLFVYMYTLPGKKHLFMGDEFAHGNEWCHDRSLEWPLLEFPYQQGVQKLVSDLNHLYKEEPALHQHDFEANGFEWLDCHDSSQSIICFQRKSNEDFVIVLLNFTPVVRNNYQIGVPHEGGYNEILNSDSTYYEGSNVFNGHNIVAQKTPCMGQSFSIYIKLPPLAGIILKRSGLQ